MASTHRDLRPVTGQSGLLNIELFEGHEKSTFMVVGTGIPGATNDTFGPIELELTSVEDLTRGPVEAISLLFRGPRDKEFGQANYRLDHPVIGAVDLFLVPILDPQPRDTRICYQAIISRLKEPTP